MYDQLGPNWQQGQQFGGNPFGGGNPYGGGTRFTFNGQEFGGQGLTAPGSATFSKPCSAAVRAGARRPFSGYTSRPQRGRDIEADISITLEDAVKGGERSLTLEGGDGTKTLKVNIPRRGEGRRQAPPCRAGLRFAQRRAEGRSVFADTFRAAFVVPC